MPRLQVLIVDNDPEFIGFLQDVLHLKGVRVRTAPDSAAGMEAIRKRLPDVLFVSADSEGKEGAHELIEAARSMAPEGPLLVVLLTGPHQNESAANDFPRDCLRIDKTDSETLCRKILLVIKEKMGSLDTQGPDESPSSADFRSPPDLVPWAVLENLNEGILQIDSRCRIIRVNGEAARMLDKSPTDLFKLPLDDLLTPPSRDAFRKAVGSSGAPPPEEAVLAVTIDGRALRLRMLEGETGAKNEDRVRFLLIREQHEGMQEADDATHGDEELILLRDILEHARSSLPEEAIFPFLLEKAVEVMEADAGTVALLEVEDGEQGHLAFRYALGEQAETVRGIYIPKGQGIIGWCVSQGEPVVVNDVNADERFFPWVDQMSGFHTHSILCIPIRSEGKVFGAIEIVNKRTGGFTQKDVERLQTLADAATFNMKTALVQQHITNQRDYYSGIMDSLSEGVMIMGRDRKILDVNQYFMMFLNRERHEIIGETCHRLLRDRESPCGECFLDRFRIFEEGRDFSTAVELPTMEGDSARFRVSGTPLEVHDEIISSCILTFHDVTRVHHLHDYLQASSSVASILLKGQDIRGLVSETLEIMGRAARASRCYWFENRKDDQGEMTMDLQTEWCAPGVLSLHEDPSPSQRRYADGFTRWQQEFSEGRIISGSLTDFPSEEQRLLSSRGVRSILLIPLSIQGRFEGFIGFDNCSRERPWQEAEVNLLQTTANFLSKAFEHARSLEALRESEAQYRDIYENIYDSWYLHDMDGRFLEVNPAVEQAVGYSQAELLQMGLQDLIPPKYHDQFARYLQDIRGKGVAEGLVRVRSKSGEDRVMEYRNWLVQLPDGTPASRGLVRDVTERMNLKTQLKHAQRMESIGTIATGISHNFRNLLAGIMTNCQLIHMKYRHIPELERLSSEILKLTRAGSELIKNLLQFSRKGTPEAKTVVNLAEVLEETHNIISRSFDKRIEIRTDWPELLPAHAEASSLSQVFMNLCTNARDAMANGGTLSITARTIGNRISVRIQDTGAGMDKTTQAKVYDPFFTTKPPGKGTGLGLSTAYGIVKQHGGSILIESEPNHGTTFEVLLPVPEAVSEGKEHDVPELIQGGGQKVLIVDDDETILQPMIELLEGLGYQASAVNNGRQAIEVHLSWKPDVILLDRSMPGMDGVETAGKILEADPNAWIILISGYDEDGPDGIDHRIRGAIKAYIPKPFDIGEVSKVLAEVLNP